MSFGTTACTSDCLAVNADVTITGGATSNRFGVSLATGDFNIDGRTDLAVGEPAYNPGGASNTGRVCTFYNDGSIPTTAGTADVIVTGESGSSYFGWVFTPADLNSDGKTDLAVGAYVYSSNTGRVYLFTSEASPTNPPTTLRMRGPVRLHGSMRAG